MVCWGGGMIAGREGEEGIVKGRGSENRACYVNI